MKRKNITGKHNEIIFADISHVCTNRHGGHESATDVVSGVICIYAQNRRLNNKQDEEIKIFIMNQKCTITHLLYLANNSVLASPERHLNVEIAQLSLRLGLFRRARVAYIKVWRGRGVFCGLQWNRL